MTTLIKTIQAELIKTKRTLAFWLTLLTPAALVFMEVAMASQRNLGRIPADVNLWGYMYENVLTYWVILILPLFISLETALLAGLEHRNKTWKLLYTQPVPREALIAAKQILAVSLICLSMVVLLILSMLGGVIIMLLIPELDFGTVIPWAEIIYLSLVAFLASGLILAVHSWVALRWRSFVVASGFGIAMTIGALILMGLEWTEFFPWSFPALAVDQVLDGASPSNYLLRGILGGLGFALLGNLNLAHREVY
jgi:hypothetical protein